MWLIQDHRAPKVKEPQFPGGNISLPHHYSRGGVGGALLGGPMEWEYGGSSSPTCSRESSYVRGQGVTLQPAAPSLQHWDSSSTCSRKSRPHFPPGATAQRDPLGRDRAFLRKRGGKVGGVGERVTKKKIIIRYCGWARNVPG